MDENKPFKEETKCPKCSDGILTTTIIETNEKGECSKTICYSCGHRSLFSEDGKKISITT